MPAAGEDSQFMTDQEVAASVDIAWNNWNSWRDVFEGGPYPANPLLSNPDRFSTFLTEYSVRRTIRAGTHERFRGTLAAESGSFFGAIQDGTGRAIDKLDEGLRIDYGTLNRWGRVNRITSALSKVAAFVRPERFIAWDKYGKAGVNRILGHDANFRTYQDYLAKCDDTWRGEAGDRIRAYLTSNGARDRLVGDLRFQRRVLDVYLMKQGGREF